MKNLTVNASLIRGAQSCQAKKDVRYYLNGILLAANGDIVGTDGKCLFHSPGIGADINGQYVPFDKPETDLIIDIDGTIPATAKTVTFVFHNDRNGICTTDNGKAFTVTVIDGKYPDYHRIMVEQSRRTSFTDGFGVNISLLSKAESAFGKGSIVALYHGTEHDSILIKYDGNTGKYDVSLENATFIVMPCKVAHSFAQLTSLAQRVVA